MPQYKKVNPTKAEIVNKNGVLSTKIYYNVKYQEFIEFYSTVYEGRDTITFADTKDGLLFYVPLPDAYNFINTHFSLDFIKTFKPNLNGIEGYYSLVVRDKNGIMHAYAFSDLSDLVIQKMGYLISNYLVLPNEKTKFVLYYNVFHNNTFLEGKRQCFICHPKTNLVLFNLSTNECLALQKIDNVVFNEIFIKALMEKTKRKKVNHGAS